MNVFAADEPAIMVIAVIAMLCAHVASTQTKLGYAIRATATNPSLGRNILQNAPIQPDRTFGNQVPTSKTRDKIGLRALVDGIAGAVSACPQDLSPCNGFRPCPILARIIDDSSTRDVESES